MEQNQTAERETLARATCAEILGSEPESFESPLTVLASPAWRGVEADVWRATADDTSVVAKHYHADTAFYVDHEAAIDAAGVAGERGVGPAVVARYSSDGLVLFEDLKAPWRAGGLHDATDATVRSNVIAAKKAFQEGAFLKRTTSVFDEIDALVERAEAGGVRTHNDIEVFKSFFAEARSKVASLGRDQKPCHRDGNTANLMVSRDKSVKLIDFDLAANCDPLEDVGCYLVEFFENDADARPGFEEWFGYFDEGRFQRAMLYGLADDMRWGLIGSIMAATSPRSALEFGKYASWRFLRLEMHVKRSDANDRIRVAA